MPRAAHLEAQLQAVKIALRQKAAPRDKVNDEHPSTPTYTGDKYSLTGVDEIPATYKMYRNRVVKPLPQDDDPNRYKDGDWPNLVRDPEDKTDQLWIRGEDKADMRKADGKLSYGNTKPRVPEDCKRSSKLSILI